MKKPYRPYFDLTPSMDDAPGASFEINNYGMNPVTREARTIEAAKEPPFDEILFDDTFQDIPTTRERRLREAGFQAQAKPQPGVSPNQIKPTANPATQAADQQNPQAKTPPPPPPTDTGTDKKIIDGEHQSLMSVGQMPDPQPEDNHQLHNTAHRAELANPKLSETQRSTMIDHIGKQAKLGANKAKFAADNGKQAPISQAAGNNKDVSKSKESATNRQQNLSMEARHNRFLNAKKTAFGGR